MKLDTYGTMPRLTSYLNIMTVLTLRMVDAIMDIINQK